MWYREPPAPVEATTPAASATGKNDAGDVGRLFFGTLSARGGTNACMSAVSHCSQLDLATLIADHQADVWRYLRFLGASRDDADDLTQETFLSVARGGLQQRSRGETAAYLRRAARNQLLMLRRREGRRIATVELAAAEEAWAVALPEGRSDPLLEALTQCWERVEGRARDAAIRFYSEGASREQLAAHMEMTADGIKTLLRRTRDVLRKCIETKLRE